MPESSGSLQSDRIHFVFSKFHPPYPPNPTLMIDWKRVKSWLESTPPVPKLASKPRVFKLIDVEEKRVVEAPDCNFEYVCLSYCWGDVKTFQSNKDRINDLHKIGSLGVDEVPVSKRLSKPVFAPFRLSSDFWCFDWILTGLARIRHCRAVLAGNFHVH
ncbi:hypothetical protein IWZ03DRAFT_151447 [Phyllosticta citriasiana]|uniref:Heterokaryon incompatibility domain-containing protein n=1 Tax=Phyllosticta citriasiana TaxID=595635 RepID=A0ABR1KNV9_9PEZI